MLWMFVAFWFLCFLCTRHASASADRVLHRHDGPDEAIRENLDRVRVNLVGRRYVPWILRLVR